MARGDNKKQLSQMETLALFSPASAAALRGLQSMFSGSGGEMPPTVTKAASVAPAVAAPAREDTVATPFLSAIAELFPGMKKLSLNQLASLSGSFNNMIPASAKAPASAKDIMGMEYLNAAKADMAQKVATARTLPNGGLAEEQSAVKEYMQRIAMFNGNGLAIPGLGDE